jgi:hypothetical protein
MMGQRSGKEFGEQAVEPCDFAGAAHEIREWPGT